MRENKLSVAKTKKVKKIFKEFLEINEDWLENSQKIFIETGLNDDFLPSYNNMEIEIKANEYYSEEELEDFKYELNELFIVIRDKIDLDFLHYKRDNGQYTIESSDMKQSLEKFIIENIW